MAAAERAGDPMLVAAGAYRLVFVFITARRYDQADETARTAADALNPIADEANPQAMSLWGGLTLRCAVGVNDPDTAYSHLERASQIAERLGEGRNDYNTEFAQPTSPCTRSRSRFNSETQAAPREWLPA